jgi:hypothetical protein
MTAKIIGLPYKVTRRLHSRKPRNSKNGTPEERAAKAARAAGKPATTKPGAVDSEGAGSGVLAFRRRAETAPPVAPTGFDHALTAFVDSLNAEQRGLFQKWAAYPRPPVKTAPDDAQAVAKSAEVALQNGAQSMGYRNLFSDSFWLLPFVTLPDHECATMGELWDEVVIWNDQPTPKGHEYHERGKNYARLAIAAIQHDGATTRQLEVLIDRMIEQAFRRRGPAGKLCRQLSSAEKSFLQELCQAAVGKPEGLF